MQLADTQHYPDGLKQKIEVKLLQTLIIENCFSVYLIIDLVQCNRQLRRLKIKRKTFQQPMMLSDTLYLEELDVKLCPEVTFV
jgi:hypothetical protein